MKKSMHCRGVLRVLRLVTLAGLVVATAGIVSAQTRSPWEMNLGEGIVAFGFVSPFHGAPVEYDFASIPAPADAGWGPAPNPDIIGYSQVPSTLCGVMDCRHGADFTYFRTFVDIPSNVVVTEFTIATSGVDDGIRVTIFNSLYPSGIVVPGSYVYLGGSGTADLSSLVVSGEVNTVIITQVDDCCYHSYLSSSVIVLNGEIVPSVVDVELDVKPESCPNPFNMGSLGVLPAAILGTADFDVSEVDVETVELQGVSPIRSNIEDVAAPTDGEPCECTEEGPDGFDDLTLKFDRQEIAEALGDVNDGDEVVLTLTGQLNDGTPIEGSDCIVIIKNDGGAQSAGFGEPGDTFILLQTSPSPCREFAIINYQLSIPGHTTLIVYDRVGRVVATLVDAILAAGAHSVTWERDGAPSGIYFCKLTVGDYTATGKMVVLQ